MNVNELIEYLEGVNGNFNVVFREYFSVDNSEKLTMVVDYPLMGIAEHEDEEKVLFIMGNFTEEKEDESDV